MVSIFHCFITDPWLKDASTSLTSRHYDGVCAIKDIIQFQFLEGKRGTIRNYLPHLQFPSMSQSLQLSNLIDFTNSESISPFPHDNIWNKYLSFSTVISDGKVSKKVWGSISTIVSVWCFCSQYGQKYSKKPRVSTERFKNFCQKCAKNI